MTSTKRNSGGRMKARDGIAWLILVVMLAVALWLASGGRVLTVWLCAAFGFALAAMIVGKPTKDDEELPMQTYTYELAPVKSENRESRNKEIVSGTVRANSHGTATQMACEKAAQLSEERGKEYGVVRVY